MSELGKLAQKLVAATKNIGVVKKSGTNTKQNYKFVKACDVANEVRSALTDAGVAFIFDVESERMWEKPTASGGMMFFCSITARATFVDSDTGETLSGRCVGWGSDTLDKAPYKAMTGALKYLLRMNFLIPDEEDPENDNAHYDQHRPVTGQPSTPAPAAPQNASRTQETPSQQSSGKSPNRSEKPISEPQQKRLFALARSANASVEDIKQVLAKAGYQHSREIKMCDYEHICELFTSGRWAEHAEMPPPPEPPAEHISDEDLPF